MRIPTAVVLGARSPEAIAIGVALVVASLAAAASAYLPLIDAETLFYCGCDAQVRLTDTWCQVPPALVALRATLHLVAPPPPVASWPARLGNAVLHLLAFLEIAFVLLVAGLSVVPGPAHAAVIGSHLLLLMLLVIRLIVRPRQRR